MDAHQQHWRTFLNERRYRMRFIERTISRLIDCLTCRLEDVLLKISTF